MCCRSPSEMQRFWTRRTWPRWPTHWAGRRTTAFCGAWSRDRRTPPANGQEVKTGVLLDTETTGLDHRKDEIIELGMVKFDYLADGRIVGVRDVFSAFNEPSGPISAKVTALTGITDEMVAGHRIDDTRSWPSSKTA